MANQGTADFGTAKERAVWFWLITDIIVGAETEKKGCQQRNRRRQKEKVIKKETDRVILLLVAGETE